MYLKHFNVYKILSRLNLFIHPINRVREEITDSQAGRNEPPLSATVRSHPKLNIKLRPRNIATHTINSKHPTSTTGLPFFHPWKSVPITNHKAQLL